MIGFACEKCGKEFTVTDDKAGKKGRCKQCGSVMEIPSPAFELEEPEPVTRPMARAVQQAPQIQVTPTHQNVQVVVHQPDKSANALGVAGVIIGILALMGCWIPFIELITIPLAMISGLLSLVGFFVARSSNQSGTGWPIGGVVANAASIMIALFMSFALAGLMAPAVNGARGAEAKRQVEANTKAQGPDEQQAVPDPIPQPAP